MHADSLLFLRHLFSRCQGLPAAVTLTAIHPDGRHRTPSRHISVGQSDTMRQALGALQSANAQGWGAYVAVGLRRPGLTRWQRGGLSDAVALPALFADIDDGSDAVHQRLMTSTLTPSLLVYSGGGYHAYWLLEQPTSDMTLADRILEGLATYFGGDRLSPAASLRLPGRRNTKPGRSGALCHLVHHTESRYCLSDFSEFVERETTLPSSYRSSQTSSERTLNPDVIDAIVHALYRDYRARKARGGWIPALCPCGHARDSPGAHFFFNPDIGCGRCHGRHGTLRLTDLCSLLGIDATAYGGIFKRKDTFV
jgi:hypothetical protein